MKLRKIPLVSALDNGGARRHQVADSKTRSRASSRPAHNWRRLQLEIDLTRPLLYQRSAEIDAVTRVDRFPAGTGAASRVSRLGSGREALRSKGRFQLRAARPA